MIDELRSEPDVYSLIETFFRSTFSTDNALITQAVQRMLAAGGKRLRPRITLLAAEACGGDALEHLQLAAYMELIHVATLIHDDVVDNATTRRGVNSTAIDYGNRISVLAGDYLFAWIFKNVTAHYPHPIPNILSGALADICDGEVLQLHARGDLRLTVDGYLRIARKKTASLFAASAQCGAIMGGGPPKAVEALAEFGRLYGIAFQMNDDLLDVIADEGSLGKPVGNDLTERKVTIPLILAFGGSDDDLHALIERFYSGSDNALIPTVVAAIVKSGAIQQTRIQITNFAERAIAALKPLEGSVAKERLVLLAGALLAA